MTAVEYLAKSGPYCRQVCAGAFTSEPLTGKNTSVGLRAACTIQFTAAQTATSRTVPTMIRTASVATRKTRTARRASRPAAAEECARRLPVRVFRAWGVRTMIITNACGGLNPAFEQNARFGFAFGDDVEDTGSAREKIEHHCGLFRRSEQINVADDFAMASKAAGGAATNDLRMLTQGLEQRLSRL